MLSLANAFSHDELRAFDARVRKGLGLPAAPGARRRPALRRRAQDRRPRHQPPLRARPVRPGRDPRRRHDRRGRHGQPADDRGRSRPGWPSPRRSTRAARSSCRRPSSRASTRSARRPGCRSTPTRATAARARSARSTRRSPPAAGCRPGSTSWSRTAPPVDDASRRRSSGSPPSGFPVNPDREAGLDIEGVIAFTERWREARHALPYETDGVVVKVDRFDQQARLGMVSRAPRWAIAYKFPPEQVESFVEDIVPYVGRTGTLTPVAHLTPDQGRRLDRRPGDAPQPRRGPAQGHPDRRLGRAPEGRRRHPRGRPAARRAADRRRARVRDARALPGVRHAGRPGRGRGPGLLPEHRAARPGWRRSTATSSGAAGWTSRAPAGRS